MTSKIEYQPTMDCIKEVLKKKLSFDPELDDYYHNLIHESGQTKVEDMMNSFHFFIDFYKHKIIMDNTDVESLLGIRVSDFNIHILFDQVHKDDKPIVAEGFIQSVLSSCNHDEVKPMRDVFSFSFRFVNSNGKLVRLHYEYSCVCKDKLGNVVLGLAKFTDISNIQCTNVICFSYKGNRTDFELPDCCEKIEANIFTRTEMKVLEHIIDGKESKEIAELLHVSKCTVDTHRRNMFRKADVNNVASLIKFSRRLHIIE